MTKENLYLCEKILPDKDGFHERMWLDAPCQGWRVLQKKPCNQQQGVGLLFDYRNGVVGHRALFH